MKGREPESPRDEVHLAALRGMGEAITIIRERRGMSREEIAPKCEMTAQELEEIERGERHERWGGLRKIAAALGIPLPALFVEAEEQAPDPAARRGGRAPASGYDLSPALSDSPFPGWEVFLPHFVHPAKVAVVEALLYIREPLSVAQLAKLFIGGGEGFREPHVRYHVRYLAKVCVLEIVPPGRFSDGSRKEKVFYFAGDGVDSERSHIDGQAHRLSSVDTP